MLRKSPPLWLLTLLIFSIYAVLPLLFPLLPFYARVPLSDVRTFAPELRGALAYGALFLGLYALFLFAFRWVVRRGLSPTRLFLIALLFAIPLFFTYPINASDIFRYFVRGRITAVHGENPLLVPPEAVTDDPYMAFAGSWADETSPYGPLWELLAAAMVRLGRGSLLNSLLLFRGIGLLAHLACGAVIWRCLAGLPAKERAGRALLWLWNPALLFFFVMDAHNDALMLFWLLLGYWFLARRGEPLVGLLLTVLAFLTKSIGLLPLPFFMIYAWRQSENQATRARLVGSFALASLILTFLAFLPFGSPLVLAERLLREATAGASFSPVLFLYYQAQQLNRPIPVTALSRISFLLFSLAALFLLVRAWIRRALARGAAEIFIAYIVTALNYRIWYASWPFPWLLIEQDQNNGRLVAALTFLLTSHLSVVIYGQLRIALYDGVHADAHLIGIPFTFGIPLLAGLVAYSTQR